MACRSEISESILSFLSVQDVRSYRDADDNLPISATPEEVRKKREPVDKVVEYIVDLLDECLEDLPRVISNKGSELGRVTQIANLT